MENHEDLRRRFEPADLSGAFDGYSPSKERSIFDTSFDEILEDHEADKVISQERLHDLIGVATQNEELDKFHSLPSDLKIELKGGRIETFGQLRQKRLEKEKKDADQKELQRQFVVAKTRDELEAIIKESKFLNDGLTGSQDVYSREDLLVFVDAIWKGEIAIDHLTNAAGFRESVYRIMRANQVVESLSKPKMWHEMKDVVPDHVKDDEGNLVYEYEPKIAEVKSDKKSKGLFQGLLSRIFKR